MFRTAVLGSSLEREREREEADTNMQRKIGFLAALIWERRYDGYLRNFLLLKFFGTLMGKS